MSCPSTFTASCAKQMTHSEETGTVFLMTLKFWVANWKIQKRRCCLYLLFPVMAMTMDKKGGFEKQLAACVGGVSRGFLDYNFQSQENGLRTRGRVYLVKTGKDYVLAENLMVYLEGFEGILKWKEEISPGQPKPDMWGTLPVTFKGAPVTRMLLGLLR